MRALLFVLALLIVLECGMPSAWADAGADPAPKAETKTGQTPLTDLQEQTLDMIATLNDEQVAYIYALRNRHGIIRAVQVVRRDVSNAVEACGKANADMKPRIENRFKEWEGAVMPILADAESALKKAIETQNAVDPSVLRKHLDLVEKGFDYTDAQVEKKPVTSKEGCQFLLDKMDDTQDNLTKLLKETLSSTPLPSSGEDKRL